MTENEILAYYTAVSNAKTKDEILSCLPSPKVNFFESVMNGVLEKLKAEQAALANEILDKIKSINDINLEQCEFLIELEKKIEFCSDYLGSLEPTNEDYENLENDLSPKVPIFSNQVLRDIKKIPVEEYEEVYKAFTYLLNGVGRGNTEKVKVLSNNKHLKGVLEYKGYQIRILTLPVISDIVYVYSVFSKKDNTSKKVDELMKTRTKGARTEIEDLKVELSDPMVCEKILKENKLLLGSIMDSINIWEDSYDDEDVLKENRLEIGRKIFASIVGDEVINSLEKEMPNGVTEVPNNIREMSIVQEQVKANEKKWWFQYFACEQFYLEHNHLNIPLKFEFYDASMDKTFKIGRWLSTQLNSYRNGNLRQDRLDALMAIGFGERIEKKGYKKREKEFSDDALQEVCDNENDLVIETQNEQELRVIDIFDFMEQLDSFSETDVTGSAILSIKLEKVKAENARIALENECKASLLRELEELNAERIKLLERARELDDKIDSLVDSINNRNKVYVKR